MYVHLYHNISTYTWAMLICFSVPNVLFTITLWTQNFLTAGAIFDYEQKNEHVVIQTGFNKESGHRAQTFGQKSSPEFSLVEKINTETRRSPNINPQLNQWMWNDMLKWQETSCIVL